MAIFGINTVQDKSLFNFDQDYICIPWNPGYLNNIAAVQALGIPIDTDIILQDIDPTLDPIKIFSQFASTLLLYDGFPTFLPCRMIMQNPNIIPGDDWPEQFRTIDSDWHNVTNTAYWKLISNMMGNIDIKSWNGNINIETEGTLGNGGNIYLTANNEHGAFPGYECGNIKMKANTDFNIYTDPRDLFLDTDMEQKFNQKFVWFSHNKNTLPGQPAEIAVPIVDEAATLALNLIKAALGIQFDIGFAAMETKAR